MVVAFLGHLEGNLLAVLDNMAWTCSSSEM